MRMQKYTIIIITTAIIFYTTNSISIHPETATYLYKSTKQQLCQKNYKDAIQNLLKLQNKHLFDPCPQQIYLDLIYAYYKSNDLKLANNTIQCFLKKYPNHKYLDYVLYMHGIIHMHLDQKNIIPILSKYIKINWNDHNSTHAQIAFNSLIQLVKNHPKSLYYLDSKKRLIFLKNRIAAHELSIIKFYYNKHANMSVIMRTNKMLSYFPDTQATRQALFYMSQAYQNINLFDQCNKIKTIINANLK